MFEAKGFQQNRDYFSQEPFEHIDTLSGGLVLTFTDLVLPGNAGHELRLQRTYSSKGKFPSPWTFGIAGAAMRVFDPGGPPLGFDPAQDAPSPKLIMTDGGEEPTTWLNQPNGNDLTSYRWVVTKRFWKYDRTDRVLYVPDGTVAHYDAQGRLIDSTDAFGNLVTLVWGPGSLVITQQLGIDQVRQITLAMDDASFLPLSMTYLARTWTYTYQASDIGPLLTRALPPVGPAWQYDYDAVPMLLTAVHAPAGGAIQYAYTTQTFDRVSPRHPTQIAHVTSTVVHARTTSGRQITGGTWTYDYSGDSVQRSTVILSPDATRTTYLHRVILNDGSLTTAERLDGGLAVTSRTVEEPQGATFIVLESETRGYRLLPVATWSALIEGTPELSDRDIQRNGRHYVTHFAYSSDHFGDYHRPSVITETGELARTTTRTFDYAFTPYVTGKIAGETVAVGTESFSKRWFYDHNTGFTILVDDHGISSNFTADLAGNVATVSTGGVVKSLSYSWGIVHAIQTSAYTITRSINPEGTVASETRAGRTTTFTYDALLRPTRTQPPGDTNAMVTAYDDVTGASVTVSRGASFTTTTVDGFGKPISTTNSVGVQARSGYDALGRKTYEGYPSTGASDIGTAVIYDGLGRVARKTNPDGSYRQHSYGAGMVTMTDENGRVTTQNVLAFGDPDETRVATVVDADDKSWTYTYNALGNLTTVTAPDGTIRTWRYDTRNLLAGETQPESGTTTYVHDFDGRLSQKTDANGIEFDYQYDGNGRLVAIATGTAPPVPWLGLQNVRATQFTYEAGSDNRRTMSNGSVLSAFFYDDAGRLSARDDEVNGRRFVRVFGYDTNDNLATIMYPSGRRFAYDYDSENRLVRVRHVTAGTVVADNLTYHPSGAVTSYVAGNGILTQVGYDPQRYWVRSISSGPLQMAYDGYDGVGNVGIIGDNRAGMGQAFSYDRVDRLATATGPYGFIAYAYDAHGNRQSTANASYSYDPSTLRLIAQNGASFGYDGNGNLKTAPNATFTFSPTNMLEAASVQGVNASYVYDADDWRALKSVAGGSTSYFLRGAHGELLTEWRDPGTTASTARDYVYAGDRLLAVVVAQMP